MAKRKSKKKKVESRKTGKNTKSTKKTGKTKTKTKNTVKKVSKSKRKLKEKKKAKKSTKKVTVKEKQKAKKTTSVKKKGKSKKGLTEKAKKKKEVEKGEEIVLIKIEPREEEEEEKEQEENKIILELPEKTEKEAEIESKKPPETVTKREIRSTRRRCPECGSTNLRWDYERAELVCLDCGTIIEESLVDYGPEWRAFDAYQKVKRQRTGSPIKYTKPNKGLVTEIDKYNRDIRGGKLSPEASSQMGRLRKWHKRSSVSSSIERNLTIAMSELVRVTSYLGLPQNIREAAALLYRKAVEKGLIRGRLIESVVAAVIYMVCRTYGIPRTLDEIAEVSGISKKEIGRTYRFLKKELYVEVPLTNPIHYVSRFASALGLSGRVQEKAKEILQEAIDKGLISGRGPTGVAAAAVYIASVMLGERRTQKEVADVAGVTEVTIRNRYRELKRELNIDIEDEE